MKSIAIYEYGLYFILKTLIVDFAVENEIIFLNLNILK